MLVLDTNAVSETLKKLPDSNFIRTLKSYPAGQLYITSITVMELRYGAMRALHKKDFLKKVENIISRYSILSFGEREAYIAGDLLARLADQGELIEVEDLMIAAITLSHQFTVITRNEKHFRRIPHLKVENWWGKQ